MIMDIHFVFDDRALKVINERGKDINELIVSTISEHANIDKAVVEHQFKNPIKVEMTLDDFKIYINYERNN